MPHNLTTPIPLENGTRIYAARPEMIDDDNAVMVVPLELRTGAGNFLIARRVVTIRNAPGKSDRVARATPPSGSDIHEKFVRQVDALTIANGFTLALAAWAGGGATADGKRNALVAQLFALGVIDPTTLAGS
jgi:hypothetical protein